MESAKSESGEQIYLGKINQILAGLGSSSKWLRAPKSLPEYQPLRGKSVLMVDDLIGVLEGFVPDLIVATEGQALFLHHVDQTVEALAEEIMKANPEVVLLDYSLAQDIKGDALARLLTEKGFPGKLVGFSSENKHVQKFLNAGAVACVEKLNHDPSESIKKVAEIV